MNPESNFDIQDILERSGENGEGMGSQSSLPKQGSQVLNTASASELPTSHKKNIPLTSMRENPIKVHGQAVVTVPMRGANMQTQLAANAGYASSDEDGTREIQNSNDYGNSFKHHKGEQILQNTGLDLTRITERDATDKYSDQYSNNQNEAGNASKLSKKTGNAKPDINVTSIKSSTTQLMGLYPQNGDYYDSARLMKDLQSSNQPRIVGNHIMKGNKIVKYTSSALGLQNKLLLN